MPKAKFIVEIEIPIEKLPKDWPEDVKNSIQSLDGVNIFFKNESRSQIKIKNVELIAQSDK
jgi:hypothetical protein